MGQTPNAGRRIALFGGSFDPPHLGHLAVARAAYEALALDTVLFAPVGAQPLKPQGSTASFDDRLVMTRLAIDRETGFAVSVADAPKPFAAPNYTIDTLLLLRGEIRSDGALFCLMGADSFLSLRRWHRSAEIPFVAPLIVAARPGQPLDDLLQALPSGLTMEASALPGFQGHERCSSSQKLRTYVVRNSAGDTAPLYLMPELHIEISASQVREQIQNTAESFAPKPQLLPASVLEYIRARGLYR